MRRALLAFAVLASLLPGADSRAGFVGPIGGDPGGCDPSSYCGTGICGTINDGTCIVNCGSCPTGYACQSNSCVYQCTPTTSCAAQGMNCGSIWNGCATVGCGTCASGWSCGANNVCQPPPPPDGEQLCDGTRAYVAGEVPSVFQLLCGVGVVNNTLAVSWMGQWFSLTSLGLDGWTLQNNVAGAAALSVAPSDFDGTDVSDSAADNDFNLRTGLVHPPALPNLNWRSRSYSVDIAGRHFDVSARQRIYDHVVQTGPLNMRGDVVFTITSPEYSDGSTWTVTLTPQRVVPNTDNNVAETNAEAAEQAGSSAIGTATTLFAKRNVIFGPNVELESAVKSAGARAGQIATGADPALNVALNNMLATPQTLYTMYEPEALNVFGAANGVVGTDVITFDKQRQAQFFMAARSSSGFSSAGLDRPLLDTQSRSWTFRQPILNYSVYWPFLAGICGLEAHVQSFLEGSFQIGEQTCFDGVPMSAFARGNISFSLIAGGGFGCQLIVASASAGLDAQIAETFEFGSDVMLDPPSLNAYVRLYSSMGFAGYFKVRVLFWSHKWSKTLVNTRIFQREFDHNLLPQDPAEDLCKFAPLGPQGTCDDPNARCDVTGACVRYDLVAGPSGTESQPVVVGDCLISAFATPGNCGGDHIPSRIAATLDPGTCYLTFDDGPRSDGNRTQNVLNALGSLKATFFLEGKAVAAQPTLTKSENSSGHILGNHTWDHPNSPELTMAAFTKQVTDTQLKLDQTLGTPHPRLFRFPYGACTVEEENQVKQLGYPDGGVGWTVDSLDWCYSAHNGHCGQAKPYQDDFFGHLTNGLQAAKTKKMCVILMHDTKLLTSSKLPQILQTIQNSGWKIGGPLPPP